MARHVAIIRMSVHTTKVFTGELLTLNSTLLFSDRMGAPPAIQYPFAKGIAGGAPINPNVELRLRKCPALRDSVVCVTLITFHVIFHVAKSTWHSNKGSVKTAAHSQRTGSSKLGRAVASSIQPVR